MELHSFRTADERRRIHLLLAGFALALVIVLARLVQVQIVDHGRLRDMARDMQHRRVEIEPVRGRIYDQAGELLAFTTDNVSLFARREEIQSMPAVAAVLDSLGVPRSRIEYLAERERGFVWLSRVLHSEAALRSVASRVTGLYVEREQKRVNPNGQLALPVLGRWRQESDQLSGLERRYDDVLLGEFGWETVCVDALGDRYATGVRREPRPGADLDLTLDMSVQEILEHELRVAVNEWSAKWATALILDPATGDVLGMAGIEADGVSQRNRAIQDALEMGSCAKMFVAASALEAGICDTSTAFRCRPYEGEKGAPRFRDEHGDEDWLSFQMIIAKSRNHGTARIANLVGAERLYETLTDFGLGQTTGIELPAESAGRLRPVDQWSGTSLESVAIGYELSCTPLQMCLAYAAVANGGWLLKPRLVKRVRFADGRVRDIPERITVRRVMSESTARTLSWVLNRVTLPGGTAPTADVSFANVSGKTGTAQKFDPVAGEYTRQRHMSSFIGFAPTEDARFVCAVIINEPEGAYYGSQVAAPVFKRIMERVAAIHPDRMRMDMDTIHTEHVPERYHRGAALAAPFGGRSPGTDAVPDFRGLATLEGRRRARRIGIDAEVLGVGDRIVAQRPEPGERLRGSLVFDTEAAPDTSTVEVPDLTGAGIRRALARLGAMGLGFERVGVGRAVGQEPEAGRAVSPGTAVRVVFERVTSEENPS